jgi:hypothetical protein
VITQSCLFFWFDWERLLKAVYEKLVIVIVVLERNVLRFYVIFEYRLKIGVINA